MNSAWAQVLIKAAAAGRRVYPLLVCGGRDYSDRERVAAVLNTIYDTLVRDSGGTEDIFVVEGGAPGADKLAREWAAARGVVCVTEVADWEGEGRQAGILRNIRMMDKYRPGLVVAFPGGRGTAHMISYARKKGAHVWEVDK